MNSILVSGVLTFFGVSMMVIIPGLGSLAGSAIDAGWFFSFIGIVSMLIFLRLRTETREWVQWLLFAGQQPLASSGGDQACSVFSAPIS